MNVLYLGISGVLHPSWSFYRYVHGREPDEDGHRKYQSVPTLNQALLGWPGARIILTSTQPWAKGLPEVLGFLGPLAARVDGFTFEDLTVKAPYKGRGGRPMFDVDYWRLSKGQIVRAHAEWLKPTAWIALDDEDLGWDDDDRACRLVLTGGTAGLEDAAALDRLMTVLEANFGPPFRQPSAIEGRGS
ncbi:HAD domain-containing protein [Roseateles chitinivorans]|uniref:HAD domain-containing protein n=1 Tax=Roseateles chitinivorans TaxID=2917965 RepID=UPI003D671C2B